MKHIVIVLYFLCSLSQSLVATQWFVSTNGTGNGSISAPWGLQTVLTNTSINPGDTVWLRGGSYLPPATNSGSYNDLGWMCTLKANSNSPVTFSSYSNEWATIDRKWYLWASDLNFINLEFYNSLKGHEQTNSLYPYGPWVHFALDTCTDLNWVNCVIHDVDNCWGGTGATSIRGCIIWHVGVNGFEHVCYPGPPRFTGNISGWHVNDMIEHSSDGMLLQSNIVFGTGQTQGGVAGVDTRMGGLSYYIRYNYFYNRFSYIPPHGLPATLGCSGTSAVVETNVIVGPSPANFGSEVPDTTFTNVVFRGNTVYVDDGFFTGPVLFWSGNEGATVLDYNNYYCVGPASFANIGVYHLTLAQWQAANPGFDTHSTANSSIAPPDAVYVIPNQDKSKRCHIAVYNFSLANNVSVNLSGILNSGDTYQLFSAQNYNAGAVRSGIFSGSTISIPMTNLTTAPILYGQNWGLSNAPPTSPEFGAFVLLGSSGSGSVNLINAGNAIFK